MSIGSLYDVNGVKVGQAAGFIGNTGTALPADVADVFDEETWLATTVQIGAPSAGTWKLTFSGGPFDAPVSTASIAYTVVVPATVKAAIDLVLPAGYSSTVSGTGAIATPFLVTIEGPGSARILVTGAATGLTGGTFLITDSPWVAAGATEQGWQVNYTPQTQKLYIEEQQTPVANQVQTADLSFVANLAESTLQSLGWALSATKTVTAADSTHFGKTRLTIQTVLPEYAVCVETENYHGFPRRHYSPRMTCEANVGMVFRRAAAYQMVPVTFTSIADIEDIVVEDIEALPTP